VIIFITGYDEYMPEGYDVAALHYLIKPVSEQKLREVLNRAVNNINAESRILLFKNTDGPVRVEADDILYAEIFSHYDEIHAMGVAQGYSFRVKTTMGELSAQLGDGFFRCHRSYIVGMAHVKGIARYSVLMDNGVRVPLSRKLYEAAFKFFTEYNFK
jgi:DNA-binding LytR/AlgR family response regulator